MGLRKSVLFLLFLIYFLQTCYATGTKTVKVTYRGGTIDIPSTKSVQKLSRNDKPNSRSDKSSQLSNSPQKVIVVNISEEKLKKLKNALKKKKFKSVQLREDPCKYEPCLHRGLCRIDFTRGPSIYYCICPVGYYGGRCQNAVPICGDNPCENGECLSKLDMSLCRCDKYSKDYICNTASTGRRSTVFSKLIGIRTGHIKSKRKKDLSVTSGILIGLASLMVLFCLIHCFRVWSRRKDLQFFHEQSYKDGVYEEPPPPSIMTLCGEVFAETFTGKKPKQDYSKRYGVDMPPLTKKQLGEIVKLIRPEGDKEPVTTKAKPDNTKTTKSSNSLDLVKEWSKTLTPITSKKSLVAVSTKQSSGDIMDSIKIISGGIDKCSSNVTHVSFSDKKWVKDKKATPMYNLDSIEPSSSLPKRNDKYLKRPTAAMKGNITDSSKLVYKKPTSASPNRLHEPDTSTMKENLTGSSKVEHNIPYSASLKRNHERDTNDLKNNLADSRMPYSASPKKHQEREISSLKDNLKELSKAEFGDKPNKRNGNDVRSINPPPNASTSEFSYSETSDVGTSHASSGTAGSSTETSEVCSSIKKEISKDSRKEEHKILSPKRHNEPDYIAMKENLTDRKPNPASSKRHNELDSSAMKEISTDSRKEEYRIQYSASPKRHNEPDSIAMEENLRACQSHSASSKRHNERDNSAMKEISKDSRKVQYKMPYSTSPRLHERDTSLIKDNLKELSKAEYGNTLPASPKKPNKRNERSRDIGSLNPPPHASSVSTSESSSSEKSDVGTSNPWSGLSAVKRSSTETSEVSRTNPSHKASVTSPLESTETTSGISAESGLSTNTGTSRESKEEYGSSSPTKKPKSPISISEISDGDSKSEISKVGYKKNSSSSSKKLRVDKKQRRTEMVDTSKRLPEHDRERNSLSYNNRLKEARRTENRDKIGAKTPKNNFQKGTFKNMSGNYVDQHVASFDTETTKRASGDKIRVKPVSPVKVKTNSDNSTKIKHIDLDKNNIAMKPITPGSTITRYLANRSNSSSVESKYKDASMKESKAGNRPRKGSLEDDEGGLAGKIRFVPSIMYPTNTFKQTRNRLKPVTNQVFEDWSFAKITSSPIDNYNPSPEKYQQYFDNEAKISSIDHDQQISPFRKRGEIHGDQRNSSKHKRKWDISDSNITNNSRLSVSTTASDVNIDPINSLTIYDHIDFQSEYAKFGTQIPSDSGEGELKMNKPCVDSFNRKHECSKFQDESGQAPVIPQAPKDESHEFQPCSPQKHDNDDQLKHDDWTVPNLSIVSEDRSTPEPQDLDSMLTTSPEQNHPDFIPVDVHMQKELVDLETSFENTYDVIQEETTVLENHQKMIGLVEETPNTSWLVPKSPIANAESENHNKANSDMISEKSLSETMDVKEISVTLGDLPNAVSQTVEFLTSDDPKKLEDGELKNLDLNTCQIGKGIAVDINKATQGDTVLVTHTNLADKNQVDLNKSLECPDIKGTPDRVDDSVNTTFESITIIANESSCALENMEDQEITFKFDICHKI